MGRALYRKYRSKKLSEIVGQEHVTTALNNALKNGTISHAYLFTGPRGTGKTSIARILAHEVNNLPYDENTTHLDIIEIDAASNRRIDEIRSLREKVHNAPTSAKYKVYIIDEVHMLTKEAFNALLKTLEEPPEHVIFILATTEAHKLPETIISRTQRYSFKPADPVDAARHLKEIAKKEGIKITDDALQLVAEHGNGSFRDSISLLDQVSNASKDISLDDVRRSLGIAPEEAIQQLLGLTRSGTLAELIATLGKLHDQGYQSPQIAKQLSRVLRNSFVNTPVSDNPLQPSDTTIDLLQKLLQVPVSHDPKTALEIVLVDTWITNHKPGTGDIVIAPIVGPTPPPTPKATPKPAPMPDPEPTPEPEPTSELVPEAPQPPPANIDGILDETTWQQTLQRIKQKHNTLYGIARMASPIFNDGELTLSFAFPFHQKRLNDAKHKQIISDTIADLTGITVTINCIVDKAAKAPAPAPPVESPVIPPAEPQPDTPNHLDTISNIFGGGEVLD